MSTTTPVEVDRAPSVRDGSRPRALARYLATHDDVVVRIQHADDLPSLLLGTPDYPSAPVNAPVVHLRTGHRTVGDVGCYSRLTNAGIVIDDALAAGFDVSIIGTGALDADVQALVEKHRRGWL